MSAGSMKFWGLAFVASVFFSGCTVESGDEEAIGVADENLVEETDPNTGVRGVIDGVDVVDPEPDPWTGTAQWEDPEPDPWAPRTHNPEPDPWRLGATVRPDTRRGPDTMR